MKRKIQRKRNPPTSLTDLSDLKNIHVGEKCFVVGAGPSLAFLDIKGIHEHVVISVNSSALLMPWDKEGNILRHFWISNDSLCTRWDYFWSCVLCAHCTKIVRTSWKGKDEKIKNYGFRYFEPRKSSHKIDARDGGLCSTSSVPTAIDLALLMGCLHIYLLGVDQKIVHGASHFWQFWDKSKWPQRNDKGRDFRPEQPHQLKMFEENIPVFEALKKHASEMEAKIYNCSIRSSLKVFEKIPFESSLQ